MKCTSLKIFPVLILTALVAGCAPTGFTVVQTGPVEVEAMQLAVGSPWNRVPPAQKSFLRPGSEAWTHDGVALDFMLVIPAVPNGEPLFRESDKYQSLPRFKADMLLPELVQLIESTLEKLLGEGSAIVSSANLRPTRYGDRPGILFDFSAALSEGPRYKGLTGAFIAEQRLYLIVFLGADPYYFDKHAQDAQAVIASARL